MKPIEVLMQRALGLGAACAPGGGDAVVEVRIRRAIARIPLPKGAERRAPTFAVEVRVDDRPLVFGNGEDEALALSAAVELLENRARQQRDALACALGGTT